MNVFHRSGAILSIVLLTLPLPLSPATIVVDSACTLPDAITAANTDTAVGGCSAGSGADTVRLDQNVTLDAVDNGDNGLPVITTEISVDGQGRALTRAFGVPLFRFFDVAASGELEIADLMLANGKTDQFADGGAIRNLGTLELNNVRLLDNESAESGGGLANDGLATIVNSTISGNTAGENGGGIYSDFSATTTVIDSTLSGNYSFWAGSGLFSYSGDVSISGSTISGNHNAGMVVFYTNLGGVAVTNSTVSGNTGNGMYFLGGYGVNVENTTFANNSGSNFGGYTYSDSSLTNNLFGYAGGSDCFDLFGFSDGGGNFDTDGSCLGAATLTGLDPVLADNGGPTLTHALLPGSSAIDGAADCGLLVDQRGFGRDASCDSGAFELDGAPAIVSSVGGLTPRGGRCSNLTTGGSVDLPDLITWNCRAQGLAIASGDRVRQSVRGRPLSPALTGTVDGIHNGRVLCRNFVTGQSVQFPLGGASTFNCRDQGLDFSGNDMIGWTVSGVAD